VAFNSHLCDNFITTTADLSLQFILRHSTTWGTFLIADSDSYSASRLCFGSRYIYNMQWFLADRTIGRAFGTLCRLSVCRLSVTFCIVAKRYVLANKKA